MYSISKNIITFATNMKLTLLQTDIQWAQPQTNILRAEEMIAANMGSHLYVLPEMWATGFATEPQGIAEEEDLSQALTWMKRMARQHQCAICGSLAVHLNDGTYRNRQYFCTPEDVYMYDKHHLFTHGHEDRYYQAGQGRVVAEYMGYRFLLLTCYDLRFPVWSRNTDSQPYDVIICVANWPQSRQTAWDVLTRSRAIENQAFLIGVNRVGDDHYSHYQGCSRVVSPLGDIILQGPDDEEAVLSTDIDIDSLQAMRQRFRVLNDADSFRLI